MTEQEAVPDPGWPGEPPPTRESMSALQRLGAVSRSYERMANRYRQIVLDAAVAEADHKAQRAKVILQVKARARGESEKISHAEAETRAEADDRIADLYRQRVIAAAEADAWRHKLGQLKEQQANGRSAVATERTADTGHAAGLSGAA